MSQYRTVMGLASLCGMFNCFIFVIVLVMYINKMLTSPVVGVASLIIGFFILFVVCSVCMFYSIKTDLKQLEQRREEIQLLLDQENKDHYHFTNRSWQAGPYAAYLQFNINKTYIEDKGTDQVYNQNMAPYNPPYNQPYNPHTPVSMGQPQIVFNQNQVYNDPGAPVMTTERSLIYR